MGKQSISVVIVDDHAIYREGLRSVLSQAKCIPAGVIGEAASGAAFSMLLASGTVPDLVLLDIRLPDTTGVEIARQLKQDHPEMKIIMISSEVTEELIHDLLGIGVDGYLSKLARKEDIEAAICTVTGGMQYFGRSVSKMMYDIYLAKQDSEGKPARPGLPWRKKQPAKTAHFTEREKEIIRYLCDGYQIKEIAARLNVSPRTVETQKQKILLKLGFSGITDLVRYAIAEGLTTL